MDLTITPFFPTLSDFRGTFIYDQVKAIQEIGQYEVIVFKPKLWHSTEKDYEFEGISVYRFNAYEIPSSILPGLFDFLSTVSLHRKLSKSWFTNLIVFFMIHFKIEEFGFN
jgi:hypothetical protein